MDYAVISPEYLYMMADFFRSVVGSLFSVGIYIVIILLGLDVFLKFVFRSEERRIGKECAI